MYRNTIKPRHRRHNYAAPAGAYVSTSASVPTTQVVGYWYVAPAGAIVRRRLLLTAF